MREVEVQLHSFFILLPPNGGNRSFSCSSHFTIPGTSSRYQLYRTLVGPQLQSGYFGAKKISCPAGIQTLDGQARNLVTVRQHCPSFTTTIKTHKVNCQKESRMMNNDTISEFTISLCNRNWESVVNSHGHYHMMNML
jgi:hypothetical protein